ncbi:hypothetical protein [Rhizobium tubonense]|jgi:hypothetical protein|uniref:Uncharacterized protein n=1 Tax=Rhizobium tubonense TaxID=484088 RepID=A0A2W4C9W6_9HYPH|nr:hypothetical protein [Rhizobium tubonense]PZM10179.1 hypothetical protein CPY51_23760 [Rhizobium tubonense]
MISNIFLGAAMVAFGIAFWLMVPLIGSRRDLMKMAPTEYGWLAIRFFPLMFLSMAFFIAGSLAAKYGWP